MEEANDPLLAGRFKIRIWGEGAVGKELSWITMVVFNGDLEELVESLKKEKGNAQIKIILAPKQQPYLT